MMVSVGTQCLNLPRHPQTLRSSDPPDPITRPPRNPTLLPDDSSSGDDGESEGDWSDLAEMDDAAEVAPPVLDDRDRGTADRWVERSPSLIRLTGKHPFNSEPSLTELTRHGFITPTPIHYVRNHGAVPRATWEDWTLDVCGLVMRPDRFTMDQLVSDFPSRQFPATLVCAGNRRKEQNMAKQSIGFNWGPAAVSTSVWRGVPLRCILQRCGILRRKQGALNVCFEGAEDLPGGGGRGSKYGTSIRTEIAMDPSRDILVAYMQNGRRLAPDHGFPVRMLIPGFIGGRMVKWLKRIIVTTQESDSYYHYKDNRVLPPHVDAELADAEAWWYKPEYIINELNINSVVTTPCHDQVFNASAAQKAYTLRGYAYSGGGKKVTRVEVTTDGGETWRVCVVDRPEKPNRYGKYWCWCFWWVEMAAADLIAAGEIAVRAWDETHNTQPHRLNWNLMGMMNNCWYRVKAHAFDHHNGEIRIRFEHPVQPGSQTGGWMPRRKPLDSTAAPILDPSLPAFSWQELSRHNTSESAWIAVHGLVYDCTRFLKDHPGSAASILGSAGTDCTDEFDGIHSDHAKKLLQDYKIGETERPSTDGGLSAPISCSLPAVPMSGALIPRGKFPCRLASRTVLCRDARRLRFALPRPDQALGLPVGKHILVFATVGGKTCVRAYTPTSGGDVVGCFDLVIRVYFRGEDPKFPEGGAMSQHLESLPVGSTVHVKGPMGHIHYTGRGNFTVHGERRFAKRLAMVAGGTGITPIYQVIREILRDEGDETEMRLVYASRTEEGMVLREELEEWAERWRDRLKVWYVVGRSEARVGWKYSVGRVTEDIFRAHLPVGSKDAAALVCGPPAMIHSAVVPGLGKMGYDKDSIFVF